MNSLEKRIEFLEKQNEQLQKDVELLVKSVLRLHTLMVEESAKSRLAQLYTLIDSLVNDSLSSSIKTLEKIDKLNYSFD